MMIAERILQILVYLYPKEHRRAYGELIVQHARDLEREAQEQGSWQLVALYARLIMDGIMNAGIEHMEAIGMTSKRSKPIPWSSVALVLIPGLLIVLSRRYATVLGPGLSVIGCLYLALLLVGIPIVIWKRRQFPVWALVPAGAFLWFATYMAGAGLAQLINPFSRSGYEWIGMVLLQSVIAILFMIALLRSHRLPRAIWPLIGIMALLNLPNAVIYSMSGYGGAQPFPGLARFILIWMAGPVEVMMFVSAGVLAARRQGMLAVLFVLGGSSYMLMDSDYLYAYTMRAWAGLTAYILMLTALYILAAPLAFLRAKTGLQRALALLVPVILFHAARLIVPVLVTQRTLMEVLPGDLIFSINGVLSILIALILYASFGDAGTEQSDQLIPKPA